MFLNALCFAPVAGHAGTLVGHVRDQNWYAVYQNNPPGVGYYEFAVNANAVSNSSTTSGGYAGTGIYGEFSMANLDAGSYVVASWDVWWRSAFAFGVTVPASGSSADVDLRLGATMWGYPAFWDDTGYYEFGQTFVASGPVTMIYLRDPLTQSFTRRMTIHADGPGGAQVGVARTWGGSGDQRLIYGYGEMPTVAGQTYYVRIRTPSTATGAVLMQMDPRPDFSDPMPGGHMFLGNGTALTEYPDRDLGLVIMSDDDGLLTSLYARQSGSRNFTGTNVGQTFIAQGVSLISAAFWLADPAAPTYAVSVYEGGPGGTKVGTTKRNKPARLGADPEMLVAWGPGEVPLTPGQTYYIEVTRNDGASFGAVMVNDSNPFSRGEAYQNRVVQTGCDLAGTILEEASPGSAAQPTIKFISGPSVSEANRGTNTLTITWTTDVPSDGWIEFAAGAPPYAGSNYVATLSTSHSVTTTGLLQNTMYHFRAGSSASGYKKGISRDMVICTRNSATNLLSNPGFEEGSGASPRAAIPGWTTGGGVDLKEVDGTWFFSLPPHSGGWFLQGAVNGSTSDGYVYQRVSGVQPGRTYTFSAWVTTWPRENNAWKYDVWNSRTRIIYMRLGIDPTGGTDPAGATVQWTPRMYSHLHWTDLAKTAVAQGTNMTVFVRMQGDGVQWHLYGLEDTVLTETEPLVRDTNAPTATSAIGQSATNILVSFSEPVDEASAENIANYSIAGLTVLAAVLRNPTNVLLTTTPRLAGSIYVVSINGVADVAVPPNVASDATVSVLARLPLVAVDASLRWRYDQSGRNLGTAWRAQGYDDSSWPLGAALFEAKRGTVPSLPEPVRTVLSLTNATGAGWLGTNVTYYFRTRFTLPTVPSNIVSLQLRHVIDDGAIFYLNGQEAYRVGMTNPQPVSYLAFSERTVTDGVYEPPLAQSGFDLPLTNLVAGENVLAAEVHQVNATSSDVTFAATLEALATHIPAAPVLAIQRAGTNLLVTWSEGGQLQRTTNVATNAWSDILPAPVSSYTLPGNTGKMEYFRMRQ